MWCRLQKKLHMLGGKKGERVKGGRQSRDNLRRKLVNYYYDYYCLRAWPAGWPSGGTKYESKVAKKVPYISVMPP